MFNKLPPKVLIIGSTRNVTTALSNVIEKEWFSIIKFDMLEKAISYSKTNHPSIIIIDYMIENKPAMEIISQIRAVSDLTTVPIIFVLPTGDSPDNYLLNDNKFVDFIIRPFTLDQIMILVRSLLKRSNLVLQDKVIKYKEIIMDLTTYKVTNKGRVVRLGPTEFNILQLFIKSPKIIFSRQDIINRIWGKDVPIDLRTVDVHINRIRASLRDQPSEVSIRTIRSTGYCLDFPDS